MNLTARWYVIKVSSGSEFKAVSIIKRHAKKNGAIDLFQNFFVPVENFTKVKKGKEFNIKNRLFPGYIMIKMILNNLAWFILKNSQSNARVLRSEYGPVPALEYEISRVLKQTEIGDGTKEEKKSYEIGENVKIINGVFKTFSGLVEEVEHEKQRLKILVSIFGRETPVELNFNQVEKNL